MSVHEGINFKCEHCGKTFSRSDILKAKMREWLNLNQMMLWIANIIYLLFCVLFDCQNEHYITQ